MAIICALSCLIGNERATGCGMYGRILNIAAALRASSFAESCS